MIYQIAVRRLNCR